MEHEPDYMMTENGGPLSPRLASLLTTKRLGHAYIFADSQAMAQAVALAQAINCANSEQGQPCGVCPSCKKVAASCHPDCRVLPPDKGAHRLEAMRNMQRDAYLQSYEGGKKVFILESAELLLEEAANNLLKLLEEPPEDTIFILACADWDKLLPTIKSRCQLFSFGEEHSVVLDSAQVEALLPQAEELLRRLPAMSLTQALQETRADTRDKEGWLHFLAALTERLAQAAKGELKLPFSRAMALKAALMLEQTTDMLRRNINQKLLLDIIYLRLWQYAKSN